MLFRDIPGAAAQRSVRDVRTVPFWLDPDRGAPSTPLPPLNGAATADLVVIGGGFTGLWTAYLASVADPGRTIILLEGGRIADGASGRNGGFVSHSLTHGILNGASRFPDELRTLVRLGHENLDAMEKTIASEGINCSFTRAGELDVAVAEHQREHLYEVAEISAAHGEQVQLLDAQQTRSLVNSPTYLGGVLDPNTALVDPAHLAWGLLRACLERGVRVHEGSAVGAIDAGRGGVTVRTHAGSVLATRVALATNAYPPLLRRLRNYIVPVYDYVIVTEPLSDAQWASLGWDGRQGLSDAGNRFHYYRPTPDGRILWGGYDAVYHRGNGFGPQFDADAQEFALLAEHFLQTFPQLEGISFSHGWGGAIDTCARFSPFWGTAHGGRTAYVAGYTGLGVGAARFGALTMLDLLDGRSTERTELQMVRSKPLPFPPEPMRSIGIGWTTRALAHADAHDGRRNLWLRTLDRVGLGFDS